jgi:hypothetical protein
MLRLRFSEPLRLVTGTPSLAALQVAEITG